MALYIADYQIHSVKYYYWEKSNTRKKFTRHLFKYYSTPFCFVLFMGIMLTLKVVTFGIMVTKSDHF